MKKTTVRAVFTIIALTYVATHFLGHAHAQSSLGIGANEATLPSTGLFASTLNWINAQQQGFYRSLTGALREMRDGDGGVWMLVGLSFAYGVFHAAGPGHGKAVISSYMLANEVALRRGVMLSFVSAMLQAVSAIVIMAAVFLILRGTSVSMTDATRFLEIASYVLVTGFGAWLVWLKAGPLVRRRVFGAPAHSLSSAAQHSHGDHDHSTCSHEHHHDHDHHHGHDHAHAHHHHAEGDVCSSCGHSHAPDPRMLSGDRFDWKTAWAAIIAVGLRPCTGALIVLSFAFLNGLYARGVLSVFAMALGTAITVSILATIAVTAKNLAVAYAGDGHTGNRIHTAIEIGGAMFVLLLGVTLLTASLSA
ncbi:nickel/cobalt transporter [Mesorhizobium sp. CAU 1732]|uniref:nickel/cobalt transporter n=1 Tax=Mesorhizobium sp. CAU 1732 TaxID=3140358 RepID=UPI00326079A2